MLVPVSMFLLMFLVYLIIARVIGAMVRCVVSVLSVFFTFENKRLVSLFVWIV